MPAPSRAVSDMAAVSIRNSEMFGRDETESEKFRNMVEVIQAANDDLGVGAVPSSCMSAKAENVNTVYRCALDCRSKRVGIVRTYCTVYFSFPRLTAT